jgi:hypothetical protein
MRPRGRTRSRLPRSGLPDFPTGHGHSPCLANETHLSPAKAQQPHAPCRTIHPRVSGFRYAARNSPTSQRLPPRPHAFTPAACRPPPAAASQSHGHKPATTSEASRRSRAPAAVPHACAPTTTAAPQPPPPRPRPRPRPQASHRDRAYEPTTTAPQPPRPRPLASHRDRKPPSRPTPAAVPHACTLAAAAPQPPRPQASHHVHAPAHPPRPHPVTATLVTATLVTATLVTATATLSPPLQNRHHVHKPATTSGHLRTQPPPRLSHCEPQSPRPQTAITPHSSRRSARLQTRRGHTQTIATTSQPPRPGACAPSAAEPSHRDHTPAT